MEDDSKQTNADVLGGCRTSFSPWQQQSMWDTSCSCRHPLFLLRQHLLLLDPQDLHQPSYFSWICYTVWFVWIHNIYKVGSGPRALFYLILCPHHCLVRHTKVCGLKLVCESMKASISLLYFAADVWPGEINQLLSRKPHFEVNLIEIVDRILANQLL